MSASLVGSEMCIRDSLGSAQFVRNSDRGISGPLTRWLEHYSSLDGLSHRDGGKLRYRVARNCNRVDLAMVVVTCGPLDRVRLTEQYLISTL
eukprot:12437991-Alexandrium_andersonii.AAC.1